ncbi:hypothetical protein [Nitrosopumilus spindle-shaped virus]|uniref:Uncharacterized protein n=1 Tax=Nitrosopumilus spindle-shaped virus TaxID=2508184 RepID=A0A514K346_9VIRU|nr:hypothetical protein [Nitrosopumilus spindle-shaped virus]
MTEMLLQTLDNNYNDDPFNLVDEEFNDFASKHIISKVIIDQGMVHIFYEKQEGIVCD